MSFKQRHGNGHGITATVMALVCCLALTGGLLLAGCGGNSTERYRAEWKKIVEKFISTIKVDDAQAQKLVESKDYSGVIKLVKDRIEAIEDTMGTVLALNPPKSLQKIHVLTLYFMVSLTNQLTVQNELNKANLSGETTTDLEAKVKNLSQRAAAANQELAIEQLSQGIVIEEKGSKKQKPESATPPAPPAPPAPPSAPAPSSGK